MDFTHYALLTAVIAGMTEFLSRLRARDLWTALTIACAAVIGGLFGLGHVDGLTFITGVAAGFGASGALTALGHVGNVSSATPSDPLNRRNQ